MTKEWNFDAEIQIQETIDWIKEYFADNGTPETKAIIGISGGKDSTIAAALLVRALGKERVFGVLMPQGVQTDITDSYEICEILGIPYCTINIGAACSALYSAIDKGYDYDRCVKDNPMVATNTPSRIRMSTLYAIAAVVGGRVVNTGNRSEAWIGYTTKYGDLAGDFHLFQNLTVREVLEVGRAMEEIPRYLVEKVPADGMSGKTDENNMGITYEQIDNYLLEGILPDTTTFHKMKIRHNRNTHKEVIDLPGPESYVRHKTEFYW